jgi:uncharacterized membrane protein
MSPNFLKFLQIMIFYILLSYVIGPLIGYYSLDNTLKSAGTGYVVGSIVSVLLWINYGQFLI